MDERTVGMMEGLKEGGKGEGEIVVLTCGIYLMSVTPIFMYEK